MALTAFFRFVFFIGRFPPMARAIFGRSVGWLFSWIPTRDRKIAKLQMDLLIPELGGSKHLRRVYAALGETIMESLNLKPLLDNYTKYVEAEWDQWDEVLRRKKGIVFLTAHSGNWDLMAGCCVKRGHRVSVIGKPAKNSGLQQILHNIRASYGAKTIWRSGSQGVKQIIDALRNGETVGAVIDQDTQVLSTMVPFMGKLAATPKTIVELAKRCDALVLMALIVRTGTNRYKLSMWELDSTLSTEGILSEYCRIHEECIRRNPWQWVWMHKRWRTLPDGRRLSSREYIKYLKNGMQ